MGLYDRDYSQADFRSAYRGAPQMRMVFPRSTLMVKRLLIINIAVFVLSFMIRPLRDFFFTWFSVYPANLVMSLQLWRLITYQFLHAGFGHILFNMLGLFFLGPTLERHWGSKRFLGFYLGCGVAGGLFYLLLVAVNFLPALPMVGASGAILGMLAACAILFPHFVVFIFLFPVPIRVAAIGFTAIYLVTVITKGANAGGDAAHLAGMVAGAGYVFSEGWRCRLRSKLRTGRCGKRIAARGDLEAELDRILQKVHNSGIGSLGPGEKKILRKATTSQQKRGRL